MSRSFAASVLDKTAASLSDGKSRACEFVICHLSFVILQGSYGRDGQFDHPR